MWLKDQPGQRCFKSLWSATLFFSSIPGIFQKFSGFQEQVQSFWAHCVMVERKKAETWTSCHPGRGTACCTVRPNYKNPPEIKWKKIWKIDWSYSYLQQFDKTGNGNPESYFEKFVKSHLNCSKYVSGGILPYGTTVHWYS